MRYFSATFLSLVMNLSPSLYALSLQEALQSARQNSPRLQRSVSEREEASWKVVESRSTFFPTLSGSVTYLPAHKYVFTDLALPGTTTNISFPGIVPTTTYGLNARYGLFDGFASSNRRRAAELHERAAAQDLNWEAFQLDREVVLEFYKALAAKSLKIVADANLKTLADHLHEVTLLKKTGVSTNYDVLRVEVQVSEATAEVLNANDNIATANASLGQVLGAEDVPEPQGDLPNLPMTLADGVNAQGEPKRADLSAMQDQVAALDHQQKANSAHWVPQLGLLANYQYYNNRNDQPADWENFRNAYEAGVSLTWNIFEGFSSEAKKREILEQRVQSEKSLRIARLKARADVALWKRKYTYYYSVFKSRQGNIGKAQESVRLAREGRRAGARTNTDLLDAETDLYRSQAGAIHAQLGVIEALIQLERSLGQKLYDFN